jgi:hypothetical protein
MDKKFHNLLIDGEKKIDKFYIMRNKGRAN